MAAPAQPVFDVPGVPARHAGVNIVVIRCAGRALARAVFSHVCRPAPRARVRVVFACSWCRGGGAMCADICVHACVRVWISENTEGEYSGMEHVVRPGITESLKVRLRV